MATFPDAQTSDSSGSDSEATGETSDGSSGPDTDSDSGTLSTLQPRFQALADLIQPFAILLTAVVNLLTIRRVL